MRALWLLLLLVLAGCPGRSQGEQPPADKGSSTSGVSKASWTASAAGVETVSIELDGGSVTIRSGGKTLSGKAHGDKRRYESDGSFVCEVKSGDDKFKLKDESGKLLWEIKIKPDKIKISDNEEDKNAYAVKPDDGGFKVKRDDAEVGKVKFYADEGRIKVKDDKGEERFAAKTDRASALWAVLLMNDIPEQQRYIIMAELGARGR